MKQELLRIKLELKNLAQKIKIEKRKRCAKNNGFIPGLHELRSTYRHLHVVYSLARGKTLEQVDSGNGLDMEYVNFHVDALTGIKGDKKLYVIVDSKLSMSQQAVQSAHVVAEFMKKYPATTWKNGTLVLLKTDFTKYHFSFYYRTSRYQYAEFKEPDLKNQTTAYAYFGPDLDKADSFKKLQLV